MAPRRVAFWLLASAGVAVGHILGYAVAHPDAAAREAALGGHEYLPATAGALIPAGVAVAAWWAVRTARDLGMAGLIDVRRLATAQVAVFVLQEVGERVVSGEGAHAALVERGVWVGLVAQVVVAHLAVRWIDWARRVARSVVSGARPSTSLAPLPLLVGVDRRVPGSAPSVVAVGLRAPPLGR